jgi:hypothetical protein
MDPLLGHVVPRVVHLLPGLQFNWSKISMLGLSILVSVRKYENKPKHLIHADLDSWVEYTSSMYNKKKHVSSPTVHFPFPRQEKN